jgi:hypothetical protein
VQVTPLLGTLPPLVVVPLASSPLEGWRFLNESGGELAYQSQEFEGLYEWQFHTLAYAQNEWANVTPWNAPTSAILQPNETRSYSLQFRLAHSIRGIEEELMTGWETSYVRCTRVYYLLWPRSQALPQLFLHCPIFIRQPSWCAKL